MRIRLQSVLAVMLFGVGRVSEQCLYQLVRQTGPSHERQFEIEFLDSGVEAFAFG